MSNVKLQKHSFDLRREMLPTGPTNNRSVDGCLIFDYDRVPKMPNKCTVFLFRQHQHLNNKSISNSNYKHFLLDLHLSHFHGLWREWKKLEKKGRKCIELLQNNAMHISRLLEFSQARLVRYHVSNILHRTKAFHTFRVGSIFIEGIETIAESLRGPACLFKLAERVLRIKFTYCNSFIQLSPLSFWLVALSFWRIFANKKIQQNVHRFFSFFSVSSAYRSEKI